MEWFVTGGTGFIGGKLTDQLLERGDDVVALVRDPSRAGNLREKGCRLVEGDITDRESMRQGMSGVDGVYHLAARYRLPERAPRLCQRINVEGTRNVLELMRELEVPRGVYTSSLAVFSDTGGRLVDESYRHSGAHLSTYDRTKWEAHYEVALPMIERGLPLVVVQPGVVYGPGDTSLLHDMWVNYLKGELPLIPARTSFCWGHVEDTARGHRLAMEKGEPGESYVLAGPPHSLEEVMDLAEKITGIERPAAVWPGLLRSASVLLRPVSRLVHLPDEYHPEQLRSTAGTTYIASNEKARRRLGFDPRPLEEGLPETLAWEQRQLEQDPAS